MIQSPQVKNKVMFSLILNSFFDYDIEFYKQKDLYEYFEVCSVKNKKGYNKSTDLFYKEFRNGKIFSVESLIEKDYQPRKKSLISIVNRSRILSNFRSSVNSMIIYICR